MLFQAVYEMFAQLKNQTTFPCLVMVDEWNECFPVSQYVSLRYDNTRYWGYVHFICTTVEKKTSIYIQKS